MTRSKENLEVLNEEKPKIIFKIRNNQLPKGTNGYSALA